jgi:hypothetical protein
MAETLTTVIDFLKVIKNEKEVYVKFTKKDGTERIMKCTLDFNRIPKDQKPKGFDAIKFLSKIQKSKILSVYDLEKKDWRSVPFERLLVLQTPSNKKLYKLQKIK